MAKRESKNKKDTATPSPWDVLQLSDKQAARLGTEAETAKESQEQNAATAFFAKKPVVADAPDTAKAATQSQTAVDDEPIILFTKKHRAFGDDPEIDSEAQLAELEEETALPADDEPDFKLRDYVKRLFDKREKLQPVFTLQRQTRQASTMLVLLAILALGMCWFISPASMVHKIHVTGNEDLSAKEIIKATEIKRKRSIFGVFGHEHSIKETARRNNDQIADLDVRVMSPTTVELVVHESIKAGYILMNGKFHLVLGDSKILAKTMSNPEPGFPLYDNFKKGANFEKVIRGFATLDEPIRTAVSEIKYAPTKQNPQRIILFMNDGNEVFAKIPTFADKMAYYPSIAAQMKHRGIVDLQVGAYSYPYSQVPKKSAKKTGTGKDGKAQSSASASSTTSASSSSTNAASSNSSATASSEASSSSATQSSN